MPISPTELELRARRKAAFDNLELRLNYFAIKANGKYYGVRPAAGMIQKLFIPDHKMKDIIIACRSRFAELYEQEIDEAEAIKIVLREAIKMHWESPRESVNMEAYSVALHYQKLLEDTITMGLYEIKEYLDRS